MANVKTCRVTINDEVLVVAPYCLKLSRNLPKGDHGAWQCSEGTLTITWPGMANGPWGSIPMTVPAGPNGHDFGVPDDPIVPTNATTRFKYKLAITLPSGKAVSIDPEVEVTDGSRDPEGKDARGKEKNRKGK
jgi:hypothetical protein